MSITGRTGNNIAYAPALQLVMGQCNEMYIRNVMKFCERAGEYAKRHKNGMMPVRDQDQISPEKNIELYDAYIRAAN